MDINLESAVETIGILPDMFIPAGINFDTKGEREIIKHYRSVYKGLREWLKYLVLKQSLNPELIMFKKWQYYEPHAKLSSSLLDLITGLYPRLPELQEDDLGENAPVLIWLESQRLECEIVLKGSGILDKPKIPGKVDFINEQFDFLDGLSQNILDGSSQNAIKRVDPNESRQENMWYVPLDFKEAPEAFLSALAAELASIDRNFDKDYWRPYEKCKKRWLREIRDNKYLQAGCVLETGELVMTGKGKKLPKPVRDSGKGFWKAL
jgi:hypothetical protein